MIIYFSATGNSQHVAQSLAKQLQDQAITIEYLSPDLQLPIAASLGLVFPTCFWELPAYVRRWLQQLTVSQPPVYLYLVATYGVMPGSMGGDTQNLLKTRGLKLDAAFGVRLPDTWTPVFDRSNQAADQRLIAAAEQQISVVADAIRARRPGSHLQRRVPGLLRQVTDPLYNQARRTHHFTVTSSCISCGRCAADCPEQAIRIEQGRPVWVKGECTLCLRCLHRCPRFAIQYGRGRTGQHGQYTYPSP
ncbi:4Fe-4S binding protein [Oscillospiraceae bacterium HV4-5-C5C]|nr:4Fe-4S binding protein [Oscillospiraceae bacterium HV4-5-C5C]